MFESIRDLGGMKKLVPEMGFDEFRTSFKTELPDGYQQFIEQFGEGTISSWVRIYPPDRVMREREETVERHTEYWFWDRGTHLLAKERLPECLLVADTTNGDEAVFHPSAPNTFFILPRHDDQIHVVEGGLEPLIDWLAQSGELGAPVGNLAFETWSNRAYTAMDAASDTLTFADARRTVEGLGLTDGLDWESGPDDDSAGAVWYVTRNHGRMTLFEGQDGTVSIGLSFDRDSDNGVSQALRDAFESAGWAITVDGWIEPKG